LKAVISNVLRVNISGFVGLLVCFSRMIYRL